MNYFPLLDQLTIVPKDIAGGPIPFRVNWAQRQFVNEVHNQLRDRKRVRIIVLKGRQLGISTVTEGLGFINCQLIPHYKAFVMGHRTESSQGLLTMTQNYWNYHPLFPKLYKLKHQSKNHLAWEEMNSSMLVQTAGSADTGRSHTVHFLHASEVAFWPDPYTLMGGLSQAVPESPWSFIVLESTPNGVGNYFYNTWQEAVRGENDFKPLFFPWYLHPEYRASHIGLPFHSLGKLDDEELVLRRMGIDDDRLAWRRYAIKNKTQNKIEMFHQEYPVTPDEGFISTGMNVFPRDLLLSHYYPEPGERGRLVRKAGENGVKFVPDDRGPLVIYRHPSPDTRWGHYIIGADPSRTLHGDPACAQVVNRRTLEQAAVYDGKINPMDFAEELAKLGYYYNQAIIVPEKTGPGYATIGALLALNYPRVGRYKAQDKIQGIPDDNWGWVTTKNTKHHVISALQEAVIEPIHAATGIGLKIHSTATLKQMENYITLPNDKRGGFGPADEASGGHDDHVMALSIAVTAHSLEAPPPPFHRADPHFNPPKPRIEVNADL
jgi:hypothetical protein